jgi:hypothetical protein
VIGMVNGQELRRSEVWRELLQSEADEALQRLINMEVIMSMLKDLGPERLEWEIANPRQRTAHPPAPRPVQVANEVLERELNVDRVAHDRVNEELRGRGGAPEISFGDFIYQYHGQSEQEYRRAILASLVVCEAVLQRVPADDRTLLVQFALARDAYNEPTWYELSHILIVPKGGMEKAEKEALAQALALADQIRRTYEKDPESFPVLVQTFSNDTDANKKRNGSLGPCFPTGFSPGTGVSMNVFETGSALKPSEGAQFYAEVSRQNLEQKQQLSSPIRSTRGFHLLRVEKVHPAQKVQFKDVRDRVRRDYLFERAKMYLDIWLRGLKEHAAVKNFLDKTHPDDGLPPDKPFVPEPEPPRPEEKK